MLAAIKATARAQVAAEGAANLSLRAVARALDVTAPAVYNYFENRDALITALIVEAYHSLADAISAASDAAAPSAHRARYRATLLAWRRWAIDHRHDYLMALLPSIPGYTPPAVQIDPAASRLTLTSLALIEGAMAAGALILSPAYVELGPDLRSAIEARTQANQYPVTPLLLTLVAFARVHGLVLLEITGGFAPLIADADPLYQLEIETLLNDLGFRPDGDER